MQLLASVRYGAHSMLAAGFGESASAPKDKTTPPNCCDSTLAESQPQHQLLLVVSYVCCMLCCGCSLSARFYALRRSVSSTLVALCSHSKHNQNNLLSNHAAAYDTLMAHILPHCGDADTQVRWGCEGAGKRKLL